MLDRIIDAFLGSGVRVAEGLGDRESRLALQRGRPPDWLQGWRARAETSPYGVPNRAFLNQLRGTSRG